MRGIFEARSLRGTLTQKPLLPERIPNIETHKLISLTTTDRHKVSACVDMFQHVPSTTSKLRFYLRVGDKKACTWQVSYQILQGRKSCNPNIPSTRAPLVVKGQVPHSHRPCSIAAFTSTGGGSTIYTLPSASSSSLATTTAAVPGAGIGG
jgi:hypothetical protein